MLGRGSDNSKMQERVCVSSCAFVTVTARVRVCVCLCAFVWQGEGERVSGSKRVNPRGDEGSVCL